MASDAGEHDGVAVLLKAVTWRALDRDPRHRCGCLVRFDRRHDVVSQRRCSLGGDQGMGALRSQIQRTTPEPLAEAHPQAFDPAPVVGMGACRRNQRMVIVASGARPARAHAVRCRWLFSSGNSFPQAAIQRYGLTEIRLVTIARTAGGSHVPSVNLLVH
ncbi:hypothetical protein FPJ82_18440 [Mycobacterium tuberculosis]|nr:hypothetical protein DDF83_18180 [Mycobacterium tuberculosis]EFD15176.1 conserved hypothetical protein [Mycobacterium tuberculosis T46]EFD48966.1 conserved hypothetical protein [Mycobacterium tuberculosis T17]EFD60049.1 conserved hypothetical protein [Mycobacterium tuberculosis T92]WJH91260.1 hypothetical protein FF956_03240 [Mycobacterium tuberculosis complex sp. N0157]